MQTKTVLLYANYTEHMSYFNDWVDAFNEHSFFKASSINVCGENYDFNYARKNIEASDIIVLHHSMNGDTLKYLMPFVSILKNRKGKLISFVGNEVNIPIVSMASKIKILKELDTDIIATQLLQETGEWLYSDCKHSKIISMPHALNPKAFYPFQYYHDRNIDIGTRSARYGVYIGDNDRNNIIQFFKDNTFKYKLIVDLEVNNGDAGARFNRQGWCMFLNSCKATLSTEAGSFYLDKDDQLIKNIIAYLKERSSKFVLSEENYFRYLYRKVVPSFLRKQIIKLLKNKIIEISNLDQEHEFSDIYKRFFVNAAKCPVYSKAISSRHFDAIGTKTLQIMYPGRYNNILIPGEHYFELKYDHSNINELLYLIKDPGESQNIINKAYNYILNEHTYNNRLDELSNVLIC